MKEINKKMKEVGALLIVVFMVSSTVAVTADTNENSPTLSTEANGTAPTNLAPILWDNGLDYDTLLSAQFGDAMGKLYDCRQADDFVFEEGDTVVFDVHWVGGYQGEDYNQVHYPWEVVFWEDDGTGNSPKGVLSSNWFDPGAYTETILVEDPGISIVYEFSVILPKPFNCTAGQKYWISIMAFGDLPPQSVCGSHQSVLLHQAVWWSDYHGYPRWTDGVKITEYPHDMCFQLTGEGEPVIPNLDCDGDILWEDVVPGDTVNDTFTVSNIGDVGSFLNWEVESYPDWGIWTFDPESGTGLPDGDSVTINVEVVAPDNESTEFTGEIVLVNSDDPDDTCTIPVKLVTIALDYPVLNITEMKGGLGVSATVKNIGYATVTNVILSISVTGGLLGFINKTVEVTIASLTVDEESDPLKTGIFFGLGKIAVTVTAECAEGASDEATADGKQIIIFTLMEK